MSLVIEAQEAFNANDYERAYDLYYEAGRKYGMELFRGNIEICLSRMRNDDSAGFQEKNTHFLNEIFDRIYLVNLFSSVEDRLKSILNLRRKNIDYELVRATNGYEGRVREEYKKYLKKGLGNLEKFSSYNHLEQSRGKKFIESPGAIGYILTYLRIIRDAKKKEHEKILILEDDLLFCRNFDQRAEKFFESIGADWKVVQLGASQYSWKNVDEVDAVKKGYYRPRRLDTCGSFAIGLDKSIYEELSELVSFLEAPFDHLPLGEIYEKYFGHCFVAYPNVVMPDVGNSEIRESRCQYRHGERMRWRVDEYDYPASKPSVAILLKSKENARYLSSFSMEFERPFNLRIYFNSKDGLRPVHNKEIFDLPGNDVFVDFDERLRIPPADFIATMREDKALTEADIVHYIEFKCGLRKVNRTPIEELRIEVQERRKDRVSVIVPTYMRPRNLQNTILSVAQQDYKDIELIIVNDTGLNQSNESIEETREIVQFCAKYHSNIVIKLIEHKVNRNGAAARNTGIMNATGEYICFLDDDDIFLPGRLRRSVASLEEQGGGIFQAVYCGYLGWNSKEHDLSRYIEGDLTRFLLLLEHGRHYLHTSTATYRRSAIDALGGFDETYQRHQDLEMNIRYFSSFKMKCLKEPLVHLKPEVPTIDNKIYGKKLLGLKRKFVSEFLPYCRRIEVDERELYRAHLKELKRYVTDKNDLVSGLSDSFVGSAAIYLDSN
ncbi:MAG: glycosyltransferase [Ectothiorhodospiraceae bacterium]|nr:glycosyltransferase [Ectothiorhodospiraceae bacterium]